MRGTINLYNEEKGYGFIQVDGDPDDYFFHNTGLISDTVEPDVGVDATFEPTTVLGRKRASKVSLVKSSVSSKKIQRRPSRERFTPDYEGPSVTLSGDQIDLCLREIGEWKLEAKLENNIKYFCPIPELDSISNGKKAYIIGRKGTGKTAIVQHIHETVASNTENFFSQKLTFKNFPFNELYELENPAYTKPNQYITIWKYIIYSYVARLMKNSVSVDPLIRKQIEKVYPEPDNYGLRNLLHKWTGGDFSIGILGTGFSFANWFSKKSKSTWQERVDQLEEFLKARCDGGNYVILFDELDEDYKDIFEKYESGGYIDLLTGLFKAAQDVRAVMNRANKNIFPVIFLRDDIYGLIRDSDKNKWRDFTTDLDWSLPEIQTLLKHRISQAAGIKATSFDEVWYSVFSPTSIPYSGGKKSLRSFDFITRSTQGRPRDFIHYLKVCSELQLEKDGHKIDKNTVIEADKAYSNYLKGELIDEIHGIVPDIEQILRIFTQIRKWNLSIDEFRDLHQKSLASGVIKTKDPDFILQTLFYFSVIGNVSRNHYQIFRHENPQAVLNFNERIVVHRGLMKALQIF